jgi:hypothetical protein
VAVDESGEMFFTADQSGSDLFSPGRQLWHRPSPCYTPGKATFSPDRYIILVACDVTDPALIVALKAGFQTGTRQDTDPAAVALATATGLPLWSLPGRAGTLLSFSYSPDGKTILGINDDGSIIEIRSRDGSKLAEFGSSAGVANSVAISKGGLVVTGGADGITRLWRLDGTPICELVRSSDDRWVVAEPTEGWFDAATLDNLAGLNWVFPDNPLHALPAEIFMRDYYEPRLLPKLLGGGELAKIRPLQDLNRVQPEVKILSVKTGKKPDLGGVTVEVSRAEGQFQRDGKPVTMKTDVYDLRLFRAGQLVGQEPEPKAEVEESLKNGVDLTSEQLQAWRDARRVKLDAGTGKAERTFTVRLPHGQAGKQIEFTAYAFNEDRVKSETARATYTVPQDAGPVRKRAYVITMGVNAYQRQGWDLHFAASDAKRIQAALSRRLAGYEVVPVTMISDCWTAGCPENGDRSIGENHATKAALHAVLQKLAGHELSAELKQSLPPGSEKVEKAEPDDLVVLSVSSHGYTSKEGTFYMIPSDSGETEGKQITLSLRRSGCRVMSCRGGCGMWTLGIW